VKPVSYWHRLKAEFW